MYAVHRTEYQLFTIKPEKLKVGGIEVVWRVLASRMFGYLIMKSPLYILIVSLIMALTACWMQKCSINSSFIPCADCCFSILLIGCYAGRTSAAAASLWELQRCFNKPCIMAVLCIALKCACYMSTGISFVSGLDRTTNLCFLFADRVLERVHAICKYYGPTGLQRLLSGKPNDCGHYYYGTLSMQF